jgi:thiol:disulfide interchange protein
MTNKLFYRFAVFCLLALLGACSQGPKGPYDRHADPAADFDQALREAGAANRFVLVLFGANWCPECRGLEEQIGKEPLRGLLAERFVLVHVDIGNWDRNMDFVARFGTPVDNGIPAIAIVGPGGEVRFVSTAGEMANASSKTNGELTQWLSGLIGSKTG